MKVVIDLQSCLTDSRDRGIGRYALSLAAAISKLLTDDDEIILTIDVADIQRARDLRAKLRRTAADVRVSAYAYPTSSFTDLSPALASTAALLRTEFLRSLSPDIVLVTTFFESGTCYSTALEPGRLSGVPTAVIAYDLIPLIYPEHYLPSGNFMSTWYWEKIEEFKKFDLFLAISQATRNDLIQHLGIAPDRICMIGAGLDRSLAGLSTACAVDLLVSLGINKPFVLVVGNGDWRKNSVGALHAFAALPKKLQESHQLVFTQVGGDVTAALLGEYKHLAKRVIVVGKVSEETLSQLYGHCQVFFFPSFYEGFGLPVLEAMAHGAPVLSSSGGSLSEVISNPSSLFDPCDKEQAAALLRRALEDEGFRTDLRRGSREHAHTFTWERCASLAVQGLLEATATHSRREDKVWQPTQEEIKRLASALIEAGPTAENSLLHGLQAISKAGGRRILIDISEVVRLDARSGIQRVVRNYCVGLLQQARESSRLEAEPVYWTESGIRYARQYAREQLGISCAGEDELVKVEANDVVFMVDSSWWSPERFDTLHDQVWQAGGEVVWMVYDLVPLLVPFCCDPGMPPAFEHWLTHAVRNTDGFICISEATRIDLENFIDGVLDADAPRPWSRSVHLGCDIEPGRMLPVTAAIEDVIGNATNMPFLLAIGTVEPRKDYATVLEAFEKLWAENIDVALVIVGKAGWNVGEFTHAMRGHGESGKRLFWLENASDSDLQQLLGRTSALIQASLAEGFGLPVVEAGSRGVPLILSDIPVFHEIAGSEAVYFSCGDADELARIIREAISKGTWMRPTGIETMTWRQSTEAIATVLL